jgi:hypothetical protein
VELIMEKPGQSATNPAATPERLVSELSTLRDAATRLSLALADYHFLVGSVQQMGATTEAGEIVARVRGVALK